MNLSLITERVSSQVSALASRVYGAAELQSAVDNPERVTKPAAFVVWLGDTALDQSPVPGQQARFSEDFAVVLAVDNSTDATGAAGVATVEMHAATMKTALVGWAPSSSHLPVTYGGSTHLTMNASLLLHQLNFSAVVPGGSIFTYTVELLVELVSGATVADVFSIYTTAVDGVIGATTRLTSDYLINREAIPESATRYQLRQVPFSQSVGSNQETTNLRVQLSVHHHLAPGDSERTYTETTMVTALNSLLQKSFWQSDLTKIRTVLEEPTLGVGADLSRD